MVEIYMASLFNMIVNQEKIKDHNNHSLKNEFDKNKIKTNLKINKLDRLLLDFIQKNNPDLNMSQVVNLLLKNYLFYLLVHERKDYSKENKIDVLALIEALSDLLSGSFSNLHCDKWTNTLDEISVDYKIRFNTLDSLTIDEALYVESEKLQDSDSRDYHSRDFQLIANLLENYLKEKLKLNEQDEIFKRFKSLVK